MTGSTIKPPLHVFAAKAQIGILARSDIAADTFLFGYRAGTAAADAVSLTMPLLADQYDSRARLLPVFEMNLPEGALRERLRLQFAKTIPEFDDLDLLQIVGTSQIGRLRYSLKETMSEEVPTQDLVEILTYKGGADLFAHLLERFAVYSGISGMQPKVLIREVKAPAKVTHQGATHIVKSFDPREYPELAANEFICTQGAAAADQVELAPAYDIVSTMPYIPRDTMALTMDDSKQFPDRARLVKFVRHVTGKSEKAAQELLEEVQQGIKAAQRHADDYGRKHADAAQFVERFSAVMKAGMRRLGVNASPSASSSLRAAR